jgi:hypothetical protein
VVQQALGATARRGEWDSELLLHKRMELTATLMTDAGMLVVWDRAYFAEVLDYDTWSKELEDDQAIRQHIRSGHIVPINIHSDGVWAINVRAEGDSMPRLSKAEEDRVMVQSEPYRFACRGHFDVSGIEHVDADSGPNVASMELAPGNYDVVVHLMNYDDIQQRTDEHPDFIVTVGPAIAKSPRQSLDTFERKSGR